MWVARDKNNRLFIYAEEKPFKKEDNEWHIMGCYNSVLELPNELFPEVKWEDEEPKELVLSSLEEKESCEDNRGLLHCNNCGGTNILKHAWVDANTLEFAQEDWANNEYWCEDCNEIVDIAEEEETNESNKDIC
jgi:hypothetical protein